MSRKPIFLQVALGAAVALMSTTASAQWSRLAELRVRAVPNNNVRMLKVDAQVAGTDAPGKPLPGSWYVEIPASPGVEAFNALQTFHAGGSMTETSDLLAQLIEGPGHGVWKHVKSNVYSFSFELFAFDPDRKPGGRIRVHGTLQLDDANSLTALAIVDVILPDGTVLEAVAETPFSATRIDVD